MVTIFTIHKQQYHASNVVLSLTVILRQNKTHISKYIESDEHKHDA
jgi:hypothetical protein